MICVQYVPHPGLKLPEACIMACVKANLRHTLCLFRFNGTPCVAYPGDRPKAVIRRWFEARKKGGAA